MKRSRTKIAVVLTLSVFLLIILIALHLFRTYSLESSISRYKLLNEYSETGHQTTKSVLFWTKFFTYPNWGMHKATYDEVDLKAIGCSKTNCVFTHNKKHLNRPHEYDAIIFHAAEPWGLADLPATRSPHQVYVMMSKE